MSTLWRGVYFEEQALRPPPDVWPQSVLCTKVRWRQCVCLRALSWLSRALCSQRSISTCSSRCCSCSVGAESGERRLYWFSLRELGCSQQSSCPSEGVAGCHTSTREEAMRTPLLAGLGDCAALFFDGIYRFSALCNGGLVQQISSPTVQHF